MESLDDVDESDNVVRGDEGWDFGVADLVRWWEMQMVKRMAMEAAMAAARRGRGGGERPALE